MKQEWFTAKELADIHSLPSTPQGVNALARREGWERRRRHGVQGKAVEYSVRSLPVKAIAELALQFSKSAEETPAEDPLSIWIEGYHQLTDAQRRRVIALIMQEGMQGLLNRLPQETDSRQAAQ
jgi:hypothetical protein